MRGAHLPPDIVSAIIDEAKKQGLPMVVHVTEQATLHQIADQGVTDITHVQIDKPITPELIAYIKSKKLTFMVSGAILAAQQGGSRQVEWPYYRGAPGGSNASPVADITRGQRATAADCKRAWVWSAIPQSPTDFGASTWEEESWRYTGHVMYISNPGGGVQALDAAYPLRIVGPEAARPPACGREAAATAESI